MDDEGLSRRFFREERDEDDEDEEEEDDEEVWPPDTEMELEVDRAGECGAVVPVEEAEYGVEEDGNPAV